jgi:transposase-like protein
VVECPTCGQDFRQEELASDLLGNRKHLCPRCRGDLTERLREHLYGCPLVPGEVRRRAREARAAARRLVKHGFGRSDQSDALMREAKAAFAALRETMQQIAGGGIA